jgi:DNA-binding MarR family transcriptional regulator
MNTPCRFEKADIASPIFCAWSRLESLAHRHVFGRVGLSSSGFKILVLIAHKQSASPSDILSEMEITKSNLSQRLRALEEKRFVKRSRPDTTADRRKVVFLITPAGKKKLHEAALIAKQAGLSFEKDFTKEEIRHHRAFFSKLLTVLDQKEQELEKQSKKSVTKQ